MAVFADQLQDSKLLVIYNNKVHIRHRLLSTDFERDDALKSVWGYEVRARESARDLIQLTFITWHLKNGSIVDYGFSAKHGGLPQSSLLHI